MTFTALSSGTWADGELLIDVDYNGVDQTTDATAFNLTITNLVDGTVETFPNVSLKSTQSNYIANVVNDPDNGSQLVNVQVGSPAPDHGSGYNRCRGWGESRHRHRQYCLRGHNLEYQRFEQ